MLLKSPARSQEQHQVSPRGRDSGSLGRRYQHTLEDQNPQSWARAGPGGDLGRAQRGLPWMLVVTPINEACQVGSGCQALQAITVYAPHHHPRSRK